MDSIYEKFCKYIPSNASILDLGCGSGRDSYFFKSNGFEVTAIDGSVEMCKLASEFLGIQVENIMFDQIEYSNKFDAVWACSSLLHVPKLHMNQILQRIVRACKSEAIMYTCFKYGTDETIRNECHYSNYNEIQIKREITKIEHLSLVEMWLSYDVLRNSNVPQWINVILRIDKKTNSKDNYK